MSEQSIQTQNDYVPICELDDLIAGAGVAAMHNATQVAIFYLPDAGAKSTVFAVSNHDPCSGANVISRGIVGSIGDRLVVASPIYKQHFCLHTGQCLEQEDMALSTWSVEVVDNRVYLAQAAD